MRAIRLSCTGVALSGVPPSKAAAMTTALRAALGPINQYHGTKRQPFLSVQAIISDQAMSYPLSSIVKLNPCVFLRRSCSYQLITSFVVKFFLTLVTDVGN